METKLEQAIELLNDIRNWDIKNFRLASGFTLPLDIRRRLVAALEGKPHNITSEGENERTD
ncbi:MAG: hypothetical protein KKB34_10310 [Bacteroidetes bacterium]|nr:hypothetical protein [Bacteroidota bacterium]